MIHLRQKLVQELVDGRVRPPSLPDVDLDQWLEDGIVIPTPDDSR
jgi:hypothetical protein